MEQGLDHFVFVFILLICVELGLNGNKAAPVEFINARILVLILLYLGRLGQESELELGIGAYILLAVVDQEEVIEVAEVFEGKGDEP